MHVKFFLPFLLCIVSPFVSCGQNVSNSNVQNSLISAPIEEAPKKIRSYTRFEKEILKFEEADKVSAPKAGSILFVGSSTIRLWKTVSEDMAPLPVINRGFGGATIGEVNYYFKRIILKYKPRFLVFYAGENDLFHPEISLDSVVNDFNHFRDSMRVYLPSCKMYFISVKPSPARWSFQNKFIQANNRFRAICDVDPAWTYIDVVPTMLDKTSRPKGNIYRSDSLHMNTYGYASWTRIVSPYLKAAWKTSANK